jgi:uncharacterized protein (TIGR03067 family)
VHSLLTLFLLAPAVDTPKEKDKDETAIEGTWIVVSAVISGDDNRFFRGNTLTLKGGRFTYNKGGEEEQAPYKIDASATPKRLDIKPGVKDEITPAIYKLDGDKLTLCIAGLIGGKRPTEFKSTSGSGDLLLELRREKK